MFRQLGIGMTVLAAGLLASGCVSSGTFKKMETAKNNEIAALKQEKATLEGQKQNLEQQKAALEKNTSDLKNELTTLEERKSEMEAEVGSLKQEKATLVAASEQQQQQYEALVKGLSSEVEKGQLQVRQYQNMLAVDLAEQIFFDSGRATLKAGGKDVLKKVGTALKDYENKIIRVVGHTDNVPMAKSLQATFPTNWDLSVARASNVVRYLQEVGVPPERMIPSGRGEFDPVAPNDTPEGRQKNRRIEIMLIDKGLISEMGRPAD
ncbi:MAG: OmpA family protein [Nitrospirota bacterium]